MLSREDKLIDSLHSNYVKLMQYEVLHPKSIMPDFAYANEGEFSALLLKGELSCKEYTQLNSFYRIKSIFDIWHYKNDGMLFIVLFFETEPTIQEYTQLWFLLTEQMMVNSQLNNVFLSEVCYNYYDLCKQIDILTEFTSWWNKKSQFSIKTVKQTRSNIRNFVKKNQVNHIINFVKKLMESFNGEKSKLYSLLPLIYESVSIYFQDTQMLTETLYFFEDLNDVDEKFIMKITIKLCNSLKSITIKTNSIDFVCESISKDCSLHYSQPLLAESLGISSPYFSKLFKQKTGMLFSDYLNEKRIELAKTKLLNNSELTVKKIGEDCGFQSPSYFIYVFKKLTNVTPNEYRKGINNE
ncbi:MAG: helix-turn-helix transcriptional regulator [Christensenellaceae bacterium]|nr:helix-turn-helix transcriptional regulator [Christensenellaceae bacterium]